MSRTFFFRCFNAYITCRSPPQLWDIATRTIRQVFRGHAQEIYSLDYSLDGTLIASGSSDRTVRLWIVDAAVAPPSKSHSHSGASSPASSSASRSSSYKTLRIIEPEGIDAGVTSVAISPDGRFVAAGSLDMLVRIWDVRTGALVERLKGHTDSVYSVAFSPGKGMRLVSGSLDKSLRYWDVAVLGNIGKQQRRTSEDGDTDMDRDRMDVDAPSHGQGSGKVIPLAQSADVASNTVPPPTATATKDGGGEAGSLCTAAFTGHKVRTDTVLLGWDLVY